jgi:hypothetical protein
MAKFLVLLAFVAAAGKGFTNGRAFKSLDMVAFFTGVGRGSLVTKGKPLASGAGISHSPTRAPPWLMETDAP